MPVCVVSERRPVSGSKISPELNKLNVTVVENEECRESYGDIIKETNICAIGMDGQGTCQVSNLKNILKQLTKNICFYLNP